MHKQFRAFKPILIFYNQLILLILPIFPTLGGIYSSYCCIVALLDSCGCSTTIRVSKPNSFTWRMPQSSPFSLSLLLPYRKKVWILLITSLLCCLIDACGFCSIYNLDYSKRELITLLSKHNPRISSLAGTLNFASFHKVSHYNHVWLQNKRAIIHFGLFDHLDK